MTITETAATEAAPTEPSRRIMYGDNGALLPLVDDESIDMIYMDPPFGSARVYSGKHGRGFTDVWAWGDEEIDAVNQIPVDLTATLGGVTYTLWQQDRSVQLPLAVNIALLAKDSSFAAYVLHMGVRLEEYQRVLKKTGNLVIHCDQTASHIIKAMVDAAFGRKNFRNEIIWKRTPSGKNSSKGLPKNHDVILVWGKSKSAFFDNAAAFVAGPMSERNAAKYNKDDHDGRGPYRTDAVDRRWRHRGRVGPAVARGRPGQDAAVACTGASLRSPPRNWASSTLAPSPRSTPSTLPGTSTGTRTGCPSSSATPAGTRGQQMDDIWADINALNAVEAERLGYPTQKPVALLERLIKLYSPEDGVVLDPFGGCGTTADAAERLGRSWVIMDQSIHAIDVMDRRMVDTHGIGESGGLVIEGEWPGFDLARINALPEPERRRYLSRLVGAASLDTERKGDRTQLARGVHGHFTARNITSKHPHGLLMIAPNGGNITDVEVLKRLRREDEAEFAVLICDDVTDRMRDEADKAGTWTTHYYGEVDRIQFITPAEAVARKVADALPSGIKLELPYVPAKAVHKALF